jgi:PHD/YefM family antitoxin component YafN of YafNO toxin-antitoxin module
VLLGDRTNLRDLREARKMVTIRKMQGASATMTETVPASEFTRNFGRYRMQAQREPVAVSSHGQVTGYFISAVEYEALQRFRAQRRSFATVELTAEQVEAIASARMDPRHAHLDALLDP